MAFAVLLLSGTPVNDVVAYGGYFLAGVMVPGTLLQRALIGFSESFLADLAWGTVTGLVAEFLAWLTLTALHLNGWLWGWPTGVMLAFIAVPRLRRLWRRPAEAALTPPVLAWGVCVACLLGFAYLARWYFRSFPLPPSGVAYHVDLPFNLEFAASATRTVPTANHALAYHWFADAHLAAAHLMSGVPLPTVLLRTWILPAAFVIVATTACLGARVSRNPSVGAISGLLIVATTSGLVLWPQLSFAMPALYAVSPSLMFGIGMMNLVVRLLLDQLEGHRVGIGPLAMTFAAAAVAAGTKPSILPELVGGLVLCLAVMVWRERSGPPMMLLVSLGLFVALLLASVPTFSQSAAAGSGMLPFAMVGFSHPATLAGAGLILLADLLAGWLLVPGVAVAIRQRRIRRDRGAQLFAGLAAAGLAASLLVNHPAMSQIFFWLTALPFAAVLTAWGLMEVLRRRAGHPMWLAVSAALLAMTAGAAEIVLAQLNEGAALPGLAALACLLLVVAGVAAGPLRGRDSRSAHLAISLTVVTALVASVPVFLISSFLSPAAPGSDQHRLAQSRAALWVSQHVPGGAVVATNSHCLAGPTTPNCNATAFWLAGFGQRKVLVGGWGYSLNSHEHDGREGLSMLDQPYSNPALLALNDGAFTHPTQAAITQLYRRYKVRWLVADRMAGPVSPRLGDFGTRTYENAWVTVYRLDPPRPA